MNRKHKKILIRITISAILAVVCAFFYEIPYLMLVPYFVIGYDILKKAFKGVLNLQPFDENFLMAVATIGAIALDEYIEGVAVMLLYQTGELFQKLAVGKSRRNIASLMDIRPDYANLEIDGKIEKISPDEVEKGTVITVYPGERVPIDGCLTEGNATLDMSALTGESVPVDKEIGEEILSGSINLSGVIKLKTIREFGQSAVSRILELVENASAKKSRTEDFISKFARVYTPAVCISALVLGLGIPLLRLVFGMDMQFGMWIYRALTFLVISCPCALVISIPLSFFACIGGLGGKGVLVKSSGYIEVLSKAKVAVLDKTGTVTKGSFEVTDILPLSGYEDKLSEYAALAACCSKHPVSRSIQAYCGEPDRSRIEKSREISGQGVVVTVDGVEIALGNSRLMEAFGIDVSGLPGVFVSYGGKLAGSILISDTIKPESCDAVAELKALGVSETVMLTGDSDEEGRKTAEQLGIDRVYTRLMPGDKVEILEQILSERKNGRVIYAGDGINDAPSLMLSDVGIAMGAAGSDAAIEAADVVIMDDNPLKIPLAIRFSSKCMRIVYQNIFGSIGVKLVCLVLGAFGIAGMWTAIFADVGIMVVAVANSVRCLYDRKM